MPSWNGVPIPDSPQIKIPNSIPQNFNWESYFADPKGTFNKFKGARETHRLNWKGYKTASGSTKKIIGSSPSRKFISDAGKRIRALKKTTASTKEVADTAKKVNDALLKKAPGGSALEKASRIGSILGVLALIGVVALLKLQEFVTSQIFKNIDTIDADLAKLYTIATNNVLKVKSLDAKIHKVENELSANAKDYYKLNKQQESFGRSIVELKKKENDTLYETREGRKIVEAKVADAKKQANDALYEARANKKNLEGQVTGLRTSFDAKIQSINSQISKFNNNASDAFQKSINATISKIQADLAAAKAQANLTKTQLDTTKTQLDATKAQVNAAKPTATDTAAINANAVAAARALVTPLQNQVGQLANVVNGVQGQVSQIPVLANSVQSLAKSVNAVDNKADAAMNEARNKGVPDLAPIQKQLDDKFNRFVADNNKALGIRDLQQSDLAKEFDRKLADFNRLNNLTSDQRFNEFKRENDKALGIIGLTQSNLSKEFGDKLADFKRLNELTADQRFEEFQRTNKESLGLIKKDLNQTTKDIENNKKEIANIDTKLRDQEKVNDSALPKLDQIIGTLAFIPARAASAIRPDIPTIPQIEAAAATGTCRTTQPGGCMNKALKDNASDITNNNNTNAANILDAVNTGANAALLAGQETILARLGAQLPGGIGGKLSRFADWMHLDRVLNILIFAATIHNALMLSNDIGQTLSGALKNVLQLIGLKKEDGSAFDIGSVISGSIENLIKGAIGADNYVELKEAWAKVNRIYQATNNVINAFQNISSTILSGMELIGSYTGKIGNALKKGGEVLDDAYGWMNPQPKFNRITEGLQKLQEGASTIQQVTQAPLDVINAVTELQTANTELIKAFKEDDKPENKATPIPEPDKLKADELAAKINSKISNILPDDLFNAAD